ncbi:DUF4282 domain-containing protein [Leifsonia sp. ZF2019]|uniref:DUF4282 domain-containing protein n=1 Tax=Leifsonia sp. ZF2019 TaxID=2781978 RepID=UPI001CBB575A|nr:DUF4282 domain-containing protein [Leifsonia sp. ZF2019]UAJ77749.1 DUF4282 domain-containing protein [Leifsonia sp. ZF2019]
MSTPQPPSDDDRTDAAAPVEPSTESRATGEGAPAGSADTAADTPAKKVPARKPAVRKPAARKTSKSAAGTSSTPRKRVPKPPAPSPVGEAPDIMDATLGTSTPLAGADVGGTESETPAAPAEPTLPSATEIFASVKPVRGATARTRESTTAASSSTPTADPAQPTGTTEPAASSGASAATEVLTPAASAEPASVPPAASVAPSPSAAAPETGAPGEDAAPAGHARAAGPADPGEPVDSGLPAPDGADQPDPADPTATDARGRRSVVELADRLDDSRFFSALFDFTFTSYVTRRLAGPVYVVGLVLIALGILVGFSQSLAIAVSTQSPAGAFAFLLGVLVTLVAAILAVLLLRVGIEVFVAIIEIAQNTRGRRRPPRD